MCACNISVCFLKVSDPPFSAQVLASVQKAVPKIKMWTNAIVLHCERSPYINPSPPPPFTDLYHREKILPQRNKINDVPSRQLLCAVSRILWFAASPNPTGSSLHFPLLPICHCGVWQNVISWTASHPFHTRMCHSTVESKVTVTALRVLHTSCVFINHARMVGTQEGIGAPDD